MSGMGDMFGSMMGGAMTPNGMMANPMAAMAAMAAMSGGGMMGGLESIGEEGDDAAQMQAQMMNMAMASMLSASAGGDMGMGAMGMGLGMGMGMGDDFDTAKLDPDGKGSISGAGGGSFSSVASQPAQMMQMMQMAQMAQMAAIASGADPTDTSNPAIAQANMIQQMMSNMAMGGGGMMDAGGGAMDGDSTSSKRDSVVTNSFTPNQSFQQQQFQKQMKTMMTNMQIARTVATSDTLKNLTDEQVQEISDKKFETTKEFLNFMKSANTEVGLLNTVVIAQKMSINYLLSNKQFLFQFFVLNIRIEEIR